ncbi:MAG: helix-turn-helix transcriptional regulator [bacterium]|nr:helix-turn-helix transcriptional regulator [bacterium]
MDYVDLGRRIRVRRQHLGLTQEQLAKEMGVSTSFMGHIERGTRKASLETLVQLANVMDVSIDGLLSASLNRGNDTKRQKAMRDLLNALNDQIALWDDETDDEK